MDQLSDDNKILILLQEESFSYKHLNDIKNQEMNWLKNFMLFYSAIIAWTTSRWLVNGKPLCSDPNTLQQCIKNEQILLYTTIGMCFLATVLFAYMFLRTRWSFYGSLERLVDLQRLLKLNNSEVWGLDRSIKSKHIYEKITDFSKWRKVTKPGHGFGTRVIYISGANLVICFLGWMALCNLGLNSSFFFFITCFVLNILLVAILFFADFIHFVDKR